MAEKDPYEMIPFFATHLDAMNRVTQGYQQARELLSFLNGRRQLIQDTQRRVDAKRDELAREEARTLDDAKAQAAKIIADAKEKAKVAAFEGHEMWKNNLAALEATIAAKRTELQDVETRIATLKQSAAQFANGG